MIHAPESWWSLDSQALMQPLQCDAAGLSSQQALQRIALFGHNEVERADDRAGARLLWRQFSSPLVMILIAGALLAALLGDWIDAMVIGVIVGASALLGFVQEWRAGAAVARLKHRLARQSLVLRDGQWLHLPTRQLVPGDVVALSAGTLVPADGVVLEATDCLVDQASLSGESQPVAKRTGRSAADTALADRSNAVFAGTAVQSGQARMLIVHTGHRTVVAAISERLSAGDVETEFERGVRRFGELLMRVMLGVVIVVLAVNQALGRPVVDSLLFAVALAVGLSPELLPAIVGVQLARGAQLLARRGVLVRRLDAIEDLGGMDVLCTDKTGTLTTGQVALAQAVDVHGVASTEVLQVALLNASLQTGLANPLDQALVDAAAAARLDTAAWVKLAELPYDFERRRLSVLVHQPHAQEAPLLVTKGAAASVLSVCTQLHERANVVELDPARREALERFVAEQGRAGSRVLAVATREMPTPGSASRVSRADETDLCLRGFLCFADPVKPGAPQVVQGLTSAGVRVKMITGDNRHVATHVAQATGLRAESVMTGNELAALSDAALMPRAEDVDVFAEIDPMQKERIVRALQRAGHAVGYLGDGINDAPALHAADVGVSVQQAVDVARESADIVLLRSDLAVLQRGLLLGRQTFANTLKYIRITTSANFGNMVSMALATPLLPFLPLTASQILLNNLLSDIPALAISADRVDAEHLRSAQRWNLNEVRRFMVVFGLVSSAFDLLTFWLLLHVFEAVEPLFHTVWFLVSLLTELVVMLVLRTMAPPWTSRPSTGLWISTVGVALTAVALIEWPTSAAWFGFVPLAWPGWVGLLGIVLAYATATEWVKQRLRTPGSQQPAVPAETSSQNKRR